MVMNKQFWATQMSHLLLGRIILPGDEVIDATAGNGNDTLFLARLVGKTGRVYAFDTQEDALRKTERLLAEHDCLTQATLIQDSHAKIKGYVTSPVKCVVFNLGYLPGGNKSITTHARSTLAALEQSVGLTAPGGAISVVAYPGHAGGDEEAQAVADFLLSLPSPPWDVFSWRRLNAKVAAPCLLMAHR